MKQETRNSEVLRDFIDYCASHPNERFWQALRNWSGYDYIITRNEMRDEDTFYWGGKDK